jgi:hypothetical protein
LEETVTDWRELLCGGGAALSGSAGLLASAADAGAVAGWIERIGLPAALVLAIGWASLRFARWVGAKVVEPVVGKHVAFVQTMADTQVRQTAALERIAASEIKSEEHAAKTLECVNRLETSAADDRRSHRYALDEIRQALGDRKSDAA